MPQGPSGGQEPDKDAYTLLWVIAALFVIGAVIWYFFQVPLKSAIIATKRFEISLIARFVDNVEIRRAVYSLGLATPFNITAEYISIMSAFIGHYLIYPIAAVLGTMAIILLKGHTGMRFTRVHNMETLVHQEKDNYPQIAPVADLQLVEEDIDKGPWAMSMNPMQFARRHKLLKVELVADRKAIWKMEGTPKATVIAHRAHRVFASQLGPLWTGVASLPPHTKALYAAFLARIEHDTEACRDYLSELASGAARGTFVYSRTKDYLKKYGNSKVAQKCQQRHAYVLTLMASILLLARTDGVLASSEFLWIKPIDRRLWYVLNNVGRQVAAPEVGGIFSHWLAEKEMERPLSVPMVEEAVRALELAISQIVYIPEEGEKIPVASLH